MSKLQTIRGMNDISPNEVREWTYVENILKTVIESYGYEEIRFPLIEKTELFTRSNEAADIVTKEMYTFQDKGGENISAIKKSSFKKERYQLILKDTKNIPNENQNIKLIKEVVYVIAPKHNCTLKKTSKGI